jgi:thiol-disulfide isomerase/thioredoxin
VGGLKRCAVAVSCLALGGVLIAAMVALAGCTSSSGSASQEVAPYFSGTTLDGEPVSLSDYQGGPLVLVFMASWCGPCLEEAPEIDRFYRDDQDRVAVLAVAVQDSQDDLRTLMADNDWTFPVLYDGTSAADAYGVTAIPTTVVIDSEGRIAKRIVGGTTAAKLSLVIDGITR